MSTAQTSWNPAETAQADFGSEPRCVVRRPILDARGRVYAFNLLCRPASGCKTTEDRDCSGLLETIATHRLDRPSELKKLTGGMPAFVGCSESLLNEQLSSLLPPNLTIVGLPPELRVTPEQLACCEGLKASGYSIALDGSAPVAENQKLLHLAAIIAIDQNSYTPETARRLGILNKGRKIPLLARNVQTYEQQRQASDAGFTLFEGFYFCQPQMKRNRRPPVNQLLRIELMKELQRRPLEISRVGDLVRQDGPLTYQLLRIANSPVWGLRQEVQSIEHALLTVGDDPFRRIATAAIATEFNGDQPPELLRMAMIRGRFCELVSSKCNLDAFSQYLLGLLSLLPAMQGQAMGDLVSILPLADSVREALLGTDNPERVLLGWLEKYELADWNGADGIAAASNLDRAELSKTYMSAVAWAEATMRSAA